MNCSEITFPESLTTTKRTASQARSFGRRKHDLAYPRLQTSSSLWSSTDCSCPAAEHVPRQLEPNGNRAGCGKATSPARSVGIKKGQAKMLLLESFEDLKIDCTHAH